MNTILVATDFSLAADNACAFAYELAKKFDSRLIIYSAYQQPPLVLPEMPVMAIPEDMQAFVQQQLEQTLKQLSLPSPVSVGLLSSEATSTAGIIKAAQDSNADIIVAGMKGGGKGIRKAFGSVASSLMSKTTIPLIVVPENFRYCTINTIALAVEQDLAPEADRHLLDSFREVAEMFRSQVYIVRVEQTKKSQGVTIYKPTNVKRMIMSLKPVFEQVEDKSATSGLNRFVKQFKVDLLAMLLHKHSLLTRWLGGSVTQKMLFEASVPLLIIPANPSEG